ncbi:MAG: DNRLRE domain-containing protein [Chitinispirillaceae bacterium]|nr:DNRLRE domain-containing protein [Chitinispirillaceae bacterium]
MPSNAEITSAKLELYALAYIGGSKTGDYSVFKISRSWIEDEATWENASNGQPWSKGGGDYVSKAIAKVTSWPRTNGKTWVPYDVLATVQEFVKNPTSNFGFMLVNTKSSQEINFASSENTKSEQRPKLTITYDGATAVVPARRTAETAGGGGVVVRARHRGMHLYGSGVFSTVTFTVARPDGKCLHTGLVAPGKGVVLEGLNPGVYILTMRGKIRQRSRAVTILP